MTHARRVGAAVMALVVAGGLTLPAGRAQEVDPQDVRSRMHAYLTAYEPRLSALVADEHFEQWPLDNFMTGLVPGTYKRDVFRLRILDSEVAFVSLPANAGWLGFRDVQRVKGKPVARRSRCCSKAPATTWGRHARSICRACRSSSCTCVTRPASSSTGRRAIAWATAMRCASIWWRP